MTKAVVFEVIARAADDPHFLGEMLADPEAIFAACDLTMQERDLLDRMGTYALDRVNPGDVANVDSLMLEALRLRIRNALEDPDAYDALREMQAELVRTLNQAEIDQLYEAVEERERAEACAQMMKALRVVIELVALVVLVLRIFAEDNDPD